MLRTVLAISALGAALAAKKPEICEDNASYKDIWGFGCGDWKGDCASWNANTECNGEVGPDGVPCEVGGYGPDGGGYYYDLAFMQEIRDNCPVSCHLCPMSTPPGICEDDYSFADLGMTCKNWDNMCELDLQTTECNGEIGPDGVACEVGGAGPDIGGHYYGKDYMKMVRSSCPAACKMCECHNLDPDWTDMWGFACPDWAGDCAPSNAITECNGEVGPDGVPCEVGGYGPDGGGYYYTKEYMDNIRTNCPVSCTAGCAAPTCANWCNAFTCNKAACNDCDVCAELTADQRCSKWCNKHTCDFSDHCSGCTVCQAPPAPAPTCAKWCNAYTCGASSCASCDQCTNVLAGNHCAGWCNKHTCGFSLCDGCAACA